MVFRQLNHQQFDACIGWRWRRDMEYHVMRFLYMPTTSHIFGHRERWYCCGSVGCIETLEEWFRGAKRSTMASMRGLEETDGGMFKQVCGQERIVPLDTYLKQRSPCTSYGDMSMCNNICIMVTLGLWDYVWHMEEITVLSTRCHERGDRWLLSNFRSRVSAKFQFFCYQQWFMTPTFRSSIIISRYRRVRQSSHPVSKRLIPRCNGTGTDVTSRYYGNKTVTRRHVTGEWRNEWHLGPARGGELRGWWHQRHKMV